LIDYYSKQGNLVSFTVKRGLDDLPEIEKLLNKTLA
jgi:hypothetical protein